MKKVELGKGLYKKPTRFVRPHDGVTRVRLLSSLYLYKKIGARMRGRYLAQIIDADEPLRKEFQNVKEEPRQMWGWVVYDFESSEPRIMEVGPMLGDLLANLCEKSPTDWKNKDVLITRTGEKFDTKYQAVFATKAEPIRVIRPAELNFYLKYFGEQTDEPIMQMGMTPSGKMANVETGETVAQVAPASEPMRKRLFATMRELGIEGDAAKQWIHDNAGVESTKDLSFVQGTKLLQKLDSMRG